MYCPKCGAQNPDSAPVCSSCSSQFPTASAEATAISPKTCGLAIGALVLGILSFFTCFLTALPAIICAIIAFSRISKSAGQLKGHGMAVTGIVLSGLAVPVIAMLMAILFPALAKMKEVAQRLVCGTNMSGIGKAMAIYSFDFDDKFPDSSKWCDLLIEHVEIDPGMFRCKGVSQGPCNFAMNKNVEKLGNMAPGDMVLLFETAPGWNQSGGPEILATDNHGGQGCNVLFVDGRVEFVHTEQLEDLRWTAKQNE